MDWIILIWEIGPNYRNSNNVYSIMFLWLLQIKNATQLNKLLKSMYFQLTELNVDQSQCIDHKPPRFWLVKIKDWLEFVRLDILISSHLMPFRTLIYIDVSGYELMRNDTSLSYNQNKSCEFLRVDIWMILHLDSWCQWSAIWT